MEKFTISALDLPPEVEEFLRSVAAVERVSPEDYLRAKLLDAAERFYSLKRDLDEAAASLDRGEGIPGDEVIRKLRAQYEPKRSVG